MKRKSPDGWLNRHPVRRLRRQDPELHPDHEGLEYAVRLYRPRAEILNGKWRFSDPQPAS